MKNKNPNQNISVFKGRGEENSLLYTYVNTYKHARKPVLFLKYMSVLLRWEVRLSAWDLTEIIYCSWFSVFVCLFLEFISFPDKILIIKKNFSFNCTLLKWECTIDFVKKEISTFENLGHLAHLEFG